MNVNIFRKGPGNSFSCFFFEGCTKSRSCSVRPTKGKGKVSERVRSYFTPSKSQYDRLDSVDFESNMTGGDRHHERFRN